MSSRMNKPFLSCVKRLDCRNPKLSQLPRTAEAGDGGGESHCFGWPKGRSTCCFSWGLVSWAASSFCCLSWSQVKFCHCQLKYPKCYDAAELHRAGIKPPHILELRLWWVRQEPQQWALTGAGPSLLGVGAHANPRAKITTTFRGLRSLRLLGPKWTFGGRSAFS